MSYMILTIAQIIIEMCICGVLHIGLQIDDRLMGQSLILYFIFLYIYGHYAMKTCLIWEEIKRVFRGVLTYFLTMMVILPAEYGINTRLYFLGLACVMLLVDMVVSRYLRSVIMREFVVKRTLVIGTQADAMRYVDIAKRNRFAMTDVKAMVTLRTLDEVKREQKQAKKQGIEIYEYKNLDHVIAQKRISQVVIIEPDLHKEKFDELMIDLNNKVDEIKFTPEVNGLITFSSEVQDFDGLLLISTAKDRINIVDRFMKRVIDIAAGIAGIMIVAPLALYIKRKYVKDGDTDSIIFCQERIGIDGKSIKIYKFRTMIPNAEQVLEELMEKDPAIKKEYLTNKKLKHDPRITKLGHKLRSSSLDEFPQFINVLKGEMSLVGPRPYLWREKEDMGIYYDSVIGCKPGITGMWQAHGRSDVDFDERCRLDDYYYKNWSLWLDIVIIYKTIKGVVYGTGAM